MKNKIIAVLLIAVLLFGAAGCAATLDGNNDNQNVKETDNADPVNETNEDADNGNSGMLGASSSITTATVSGGMYLEIVGRTQGAINGECKDGGDKKDTVALVDFSDGVTVPVDNESGLTKGKRGYDAVTFVHKIDTASPKLHKALTTGELLNLTVDFYRTKGDGTEEKYYSIIYEDAIIVSMEIFTEERNTHFEEVSFTFGKVTYVFNDGNISFSDTWK